MKISTKRKYNLAKGGLVATIPPIGIVLLVLLCLGIYIPRSMLASSSVIFPLSPLDSAISSTRSSLPPHPIRDSLHTEDSDFILDSLSKVPQIPGSQTEISTDSISKSLSDASPSSDKEREEPIVLDDVVTFSAQDSMILRGQNLIFLHGNGDVKYGTMNLTSSYMRMRVDSSEVYARYILDSLGRPIDMPLFSDGTQQFEMETLRYNYNTEKGYITGVLTQQEGGYLTGDRGKRMPDNTLFLASGNFTTCDQVHAPHFCIHMTRAKITPNKNIVTGPVYLVMGGVPLYPIGLPFGFFPFNEKRTSGIMLPSYGEESERGFYLRNFGLYLVPNDYFDLTFRGDFYTLGSWAVYAESSYNIRYMCSGNVSLSYVYSQSGDKSIPGDFSSSRDFSFNWSHRQDQKVDPLRTFSASVNFSTSSYNHNSYDTMYDPDKRAQNTKGSSVSYTRRFTSIPLTITAALNIDQRSRDSTISVTLPNLSLSLATIYPFKRKNAVGKERWYEKISLSYSGNFSNSITTKENLLLKSNLLHDWRNGMRHSIPISASFDLFNYIKVTPSISYNAIWQTRKVSKEYDPGLGQIVPADTTYGFYHLNDFSASLGISTTLYGFYRPWDIFGDRIQMIRHRFSPSVSFSYRPDFGTPFWGYYETLHYTDQQGNPVEQIYSPYEGGMFSVPGRGKSGTISMNFANNLEMKLRNPADSTGEGSRKISLIDQFDWRIGYNMAADSMRWSNISATLALRFSRSMVIRLSGDFDTYLYDYTLGSNGKPIPRKINKLRILNGKGLGRLVSTGTSFNYTFNNQTFSKLENFFNRLFKKKTADGNDEPENQRSDTRMPASGTPSREDQFSQSPGGFSKASGGGFRGRGNYDRPSDMGVLDDDGYVSWNFPWSLSVNYSMRLGYDTQNFNIEKKEYPYRLQHNLSFRGTLDPSQNWNISFDANYNFELKKLTNMTISATRRLHCWELTANIIPLGPYKSYMVTIGATGDLFRDLRYQQSNLTTTGAAGGQRGYF